MARSRLFSRASRIASLSDNCSLPSRINWLSSGEFVRRGSGTSLDEYQPKGLFDFGTSKEADGLVWAKAVAERPMRNQARNLLNCFARPVFLMALLPDRAEAQGWLCG